MRSIQLAALLPLLLAGCDITPIQPGDGNAILANTAATEALNPGAQPVRIGEAGQQFEACANRGTVVNLGAGETLPIRAAPFAEAEEVGRLVPGQRMYVCTRSIDQRWLGVVVPPEGEAMGDCGVSARVERPRAYAGPCTSGWVTNGFIRLGAG